MSDILTVEFPAHISHVPAGDPMDLAKDSIIIEDSGTEYLVGIDARQEKPDSVRQFGGSLHAPQYRRLLKAALAQALGEGTYELTVALSAPHHQIDKFRRAKSTYSLSDEAFEHFKNSVEEIHFKKYRSDAQWRTLTLKPKEEVRVYYEYQAVAMALPESVRSYILWQIGYGDWQQTALVDGMPMKDAGKRLEGLSGAVKLFAERSGLAFGDAAQAWETESMTDMLSDSGLNGKKISVKDLKESCLRHWIGAATGDLLPSIEQWRKRIKNIIVSGGLAKDDTFWRIFKEEMEGQDFSLWPIHGLPEKYRVPSCSDASMTCIQGLLTKADLAIDLGNGRLKVGLRRGKK